MLNVWTGRQRIDCERHCQWLQHFFIDCEWPSQWLSALSACVDKASGKVCRKKTQVSVLSRCSNFLSVTLLILTAAMLNIPRRQSTRFVFSMERWSAASTCDLKTECISHGWSYCAALSTRGCAIVERCLFTFNKRFFKPSHLSLPLWETALGATKLICYGTIGHCPTQSKLQRNTNAGQTEPMLGGARV